MEHIVVTYYRRRNVFLDGKPIGKTGDTLMVEEGTHRVDLGDPKNYTPTFRKAKVFGTNPNAPLIVTFSPVEVSP